MPRNLPHQGRILPHERECDDVTPIIGGNVLPSTSYEVALHETTKLDRSDRSQKDNRCRIIRICKYWEKHHPQYYELGTRAVSENDLQNPTNFFITGIKEILFMLA